jgi:DNA-binding transcriptional LysR family regulator
VLDVRKLKALREIALRGSFSAAAEQLNYSQSAISQQVAQLERQAGTLLIERLGRGVRLTEAGSKLVDRADLILRQLAEAEAELEAAAGGRTITVRLAVFGSAVGTWMVPAVHAFRRRHPTVLLVLTVAESEAAIEMVLTGDVDLAVVTRAAGSAVDGSLALQELFRDPLRVAMAADHPLADRASLRLADLAGEPWMVATSRECADWVVFSDACRRAGFAPRIAYRHEDYLTLLGLVAAGLGVALIPGIVHAAIRCDGVTVLPIAPREPTRRVAAVAIRAAVNQPAVSAMLAALRAHPPVDPVAAVTAVTAVTDLRVAGLG